MGERGLQDIVKLNNNNNNNKVSLIQPPENIRVVGSTDLRNSR
jgi:hypothetical protein